jgi:hypothetical protein
MKVSGQFHSLATLLPEKKAPVPTLDRRLGGLRTSLDDVKKRNILPLPGLKL